MLVNIFRRIAYKFYLIGEKEADRIKAVRRTNEISSKTDIDRSSVIADDSVITNGTGDRTRIQIGKNSLINGWLLIYNHGGKIKIGDDCFIGPDTKIWSACSVEIGNKVLISHNVNIHDNNSHPLNSKERHDDFKYIFKNGLNIEANYSERPVIIEDDVWIGFNAIVLKGIRIGRGAIIGAGVIVTKDIPPFAVVVGNPARIIKYVD